jgi:hypothetical protein
MARVSAVMFILAPSSSFSLRAEAVLAPATQFRISDFGFETRRFIRASRHVMGLIPCPKMLMSLGEDPSEFFALAMRRGCRYGETPASD